MNIGKTHAFSSQVLVTLDGRLLSLRELSSCRSLLLVYVRHFALPTSCDHAKTIWEKKELFHAQGFSPMFVGAGSSAAAKKFSETFAVPETLLLRDTRLVTFELFELFELMKAPGGNSDLKIPVGGIIALRPGGKIATRQIIPTAPAGL